METASHLSPVLGRYYQRQWSHGKGHRLYDTDGRAYLDFANGIAVSALGHVHPKVTAAIHLHAARLWWKGLKLNRRPAGPNHTVDYLPEARSRP